MAAVSHSFDVWTESPASVEQIHATFSREDYWLTRLGAGDAVTTLDSLVVATDGTVTMEATQHLGRQLLPGAIARLLPAELTIRHSEIWKVVGVREVRGHVRVSASGGFGSGHGKALLTPANAGSKMHFAVRVDIRIPLVGGSLEKSIGAGLASNIPELQRFTTAWVAEHG